MPTDFSDRIEEIANGPKEASHADGRSLTAQDIDAVIKAEEHLAAKEAVTKNHFGLRFVRPYNCGPAGFQ